MRIQVPRAATTRPPGMICQVVMFSNHTSRKVVVNSKGLPVGQVEPEAQARNAWLMLVFYRRRALFGGRTRRRYARARSR